MVLKSLDLKVQPSHTEGASLECNMPVMLKVVKCRKYNHINRIKGLARAFKFCTQALFSMCA